MEKLLELLNEYEKEVKKSEIVWSIDNDGDICSQTYEGVDYNEYTKYMNTNNLISKSFGFIKWLVDNDKIDFELDSIIHKHKGIDYNTGKGIVVEKLCGRYESLLMLLSIQDSPIEFLVSILK